MALTVGSVLRETDATGDAIKTFADANSRLVQAMAVVDADGAQAGIGGVPLITEERPAVSWATTAGTLENQRTVKASSGRIYFARVVVDSTVASPRYLMVFDTAAAVVNGAVPVYRALIPAGTQVDVSFGGRTLATGIVVAISTTLATLTLPGSSEATFHVGYA